MFIAPDAVCPEGDWVKYENHCYSFHKVIWRKSNFAVANMECRILGGTLASILNQKENDFIFTEVKNRSIGDTWTGYFRKGRASE